MGNRYGSLFFFGYLGKQKKYMDRKNEACEKVLNSIKKVLIEKNKRYGNAALEPLGVFYKGDAENSIKIRLDDKLSRIKNSKTLRKNDLYDLLGYCILYLINKEYNDAPFKNAVDEILHFIHEEYVNHLYESNAYGDVSTFSFNGFTKDGQESDVIKSLNGVCSIIKDDEDAYFHPVLELILYLVIYFIENNITDFSDLID